MEHDGAAGDAAHESPEGRLSRVRVALVVERTEAEGPGVRYALWVQGCTLRCRGCCNPEFLPADRDGARSRSPLELAEEALRSSNEGVSLLGGEPFEQADALADFARRIRDAGRTVMVFSGYTLGELRERALREPGVASLLAETDLLVDGRYEASLRTTTRRWIGSTNQQLHFLSDRYDPSDARFGEPNTLELRLRNGVLELNGFPVHGSATRLVTSLVREVPPERRAGRLPKT